MPETYNVFIFCEKKEKSFNFYCSKEDLTRLQSAWRDVGIEQLQSSPAGAIEKSWNFVVEASNSEDLLNTCLMMFSLRDVEKIKAFPKGYGKAE